MVAPESERVKCGELGYLPHELLGMLIFPRPGRVELPVWPARVHFEGLQNPVWARF